MIQVLAHVLFFLWCAGAAEAFYSLPPLPPPHEFGNVLMDKNSLSDRPGPVVFPHWSHRLYFTCGTCHSELEFGMTANMTQISPEDHTSGKLCSACHDGRSAFAPDGNCQRCHGELLDWRAGFDFFSSKPFPFTPYGNGIDWVSSLARGLIAPADHLRRPQPRMPFSRNLDLPADMSRIPTAIFPHEAHTLWMGCELCHPELFAISRKTTREFSMSAINEGKFCGVCHLRVAFPVNDCARCHPAMQGRR